jgi:hypothetical protein
MTLKINCIALPLPGKGWDGAFFCPPFAKKGGRQNMYFVHPPHPPLKLNFSQFSAFRQSAGKIKSGQVGSFLPTILKIKLPILPVFTKNRHSITFSAGNYIKTLVTKTYQMLPEFKAVVGVSTKHKKVTTILPEKKEVT